MGLVWRSAGPVHACTRGCNLSGLALASALVVVLLLHVCTHVLVTLQGRVPAARHVDDGATCV